MVPTATAPPAGALRLRDGARTVTLAPGQAEQTPLADARSHGGRVEGDGMACMQVAWGQGTLRGGLSDPGRFTAADPRERASEPRPHCGRAVMRATMNLSRSGNSEPEAWR
ncbi:hypothetical protein Ari01nite_55620 [Paractinoplanes rishiriensis]|uniref:Uncharacterized protein n=1 Tax=Paractinoplanes rishiriensis TaxID=1050105 RepID=A0A919K3D5_9ACTN|nr:hypothetical protein Ari01nite_55620 [Actinoplanes rishiriensis]